jgi:hypothetical protein
LVLSLILGYLQDKVHQGNNGTTFEKAVEQKQLQTPAATAPAQPAALPATQPASPSALPVTIPVATNAPAAK